LVQLAWGKSMAILSDKNINYFKSYQARVAQGIASGGVQSPYFVAQDTFIQQYEYLRAVWIRGVKVEEVTKEYRISRSQYYKTEQAFLKSGVVGLLGLPSFPSQDGKLEKLTLLIKKSRPSLSYTAIHRITQSVPILANKSHPEIISTILRSHGYGISEMVEDIEFLGRIQRTIETYNLLVNKTIKGRNLKKRKETFLVDKDMAHRRIELLRSLYFNKKESFGEICTRHGISRQTTYRLIEDYKIYGPWAIIPAQSAGREYMSPEIHIRILLEKLKHPNWSCQMIVDSLNLKVSRHFVYRVIEEWELHDKTRNAVAIDEFLGIDTKTPEQFKPYQTAYTLLPEKELLATRRINRHFELLCKKMKTHKYHFCDPGPIILAPFVSRLGVAQAFELYGPPKLRGKEISNLALLNVFRILTGYRHINHVSNHKDRSVAFASGLGMFGSSSKFYENSIEFTFAQLHKMRTDLVARAKELGLIEGLSIGFDFHFKEFYGKNAQDKQIGKGPDKSGNLVPGFRPHVAWDLASNVIISIAYFQGAARAPRILKRFCNQNIFPIFDPLAIKEIYMDSEYTKEEDFHYLKEVSCKNGELYICLKKNPQIKKFIKPILADPKSWSDYNEIDEINSVQTSLPKTGLTLKIVVLRNKVTKDNIRCFGSTHSQLKSEDILQKYRYRWLIENGIKDLVASYFIDETFGLDPIKIEFEFYCIMVARLVFEFFLKSLGGSYYHKMDGNKTTLTKMRDLLFEKRNCTLELTSSNDFLLTILDDHHSKLLQNSSAMLLDLKQQNKNKVLWWNNRSILLQSENQFR